VAEAGSSHCVRSVVITTGDLHPMSVLVTSVRMDLILY
jgi:hypothetical protein